MCLIINPTKPGINALSQLTDAQLLQAYQSNNDGFGLMYSLQHPKPALCTLKFAAHETDGYHFIDTFRQHQHLDPVVHLRFATHGDTSAENAHPFIINHATKRITYGVMHNGVLPQNSYTQPRSKRSKHSDTNLFVEQVLTPLLNVDPDALQKPHITALLERLIGSNRIAILDSKGRFTYLNERYTTKYTDLNLQLSNTYYLDLDNDNDINYYTEDLSWT